VRTGKGVPKDQAKTSGSYGGAGEGERRADATDARTGRRATS